MSEVLQLQEAPGLPDHYLGQVALNVPGVIEPVFERTVQERAWDLIATRDVPETPVGEQERYDNGRTILMEAMTREGHLSRIELYGTFEEINAQVLSRLVNGWDDSLPFHEKRRRFAELSNELTIQDTQHKIVAGELPPETQVIETSNFPKIMGESGGKIGYRYDNLKGMVRATALEYLGDGQYCRIIEQVSRSNGVYETTADFYAARGINIPNSVDSDVLFLETPIVTDEFRDGVVDVVVELDRRSGNDIRYGSQLHDNQLPYEFLRSQSARREGNVDRYSERLASLEERLDLKVAMGQIAISEKVKDYKKELERALDEICKIMPEYAEDTFGKQAAEYFKSANDYMVRGDYQIAERLLVEANMYKQMVIFCGGSISSTASRFNRVSNDNIDADSDEFGKLTFSCPHCSHTNRRQPGPGNFVTNCQNKKCGKDVTC